MHAQAEPVPPGAPSVRRQRTASRSVPAARELASLPRGELNGSRKQEHDADRDGHGSREGRPAHFRCNQYKTDRVSGYAEDGNSGGTPSLVLYPGSARTGRSIVTLESAAEGTAKKCRNNSYVPSIKCTSMWSPIL